MSFTLYAADAGYWAGWSSVVGASQAWQALDDDPYDSDTSYVRFNLAAPALPSPQGRLSVRIVQVGLADVLPSTVSVFAVARVNLAGAPGTNPTVAVGFSNQDRQVTSGAAAELTAAYGFVLASFTTNPYTGAAWTRGALAGLELFLTVATLPMPNRHVRVTQIGITFDSNRPTVYRTNGRGVLTR